MSDAWRRAAASCTPERRCGSAAGEARDAVAKASVRHPQKPEPILFAKILYKVACLGRIHIVQLSFSFS